MAVIIRKEKKIGDEYEMEVYCDAVSELPNDGMIDYHKVRGGSFAYDKSGALAICGSDGTWSTVE